MGPAMSETPLRPGWTPTEALADRVSGEPGPGEVGAAGGQRGDADQALQPFERQRDLPSHPVEPHPVGGKVIGVETRSSAATSDTTWVLRPLCRFLWTTRRRLRSDWAPNFGCRRVPCSRVPR